MKAPKPLYPEAPVNLRGLTVRQGYKAERMKRPMSWIERMYPNLTDDEKHLLRLFLLGRAPQNMPPDLMAKAESALDRLKAA